MNTTCPSPPTAPSSSDAAFLHAAHHKNNSENTTNDKSLLFLRLPFPWALHEMLDSVEQNSLQEFISWSEDGTSFKVHDTHGFVQYVAPLYFKQTKYKSFQRQLHLYGFTRIAKGTYRGYRSHPLFQRNQKHLCMNMKRIKNSSSKNRNAKNEDKNTTTTTTTTKITRTVSSTSLLEEAVTDAVVSSSTVSSKPATNKTMTSSKTMVSTKTPTRADSSTITIIIPGEDDKSRVVVPASETSNNKTKCDADGALDVAPATTDAEAETEVVEDDMWLNSYIDNFNMMNSSIPLSSSSSSTCTTCINDMEPRPIKDDSCISSSSVVVEDVFDSLFPSQTTSAEVQQQQQQDLQTVKVCSVMTRRRSTTKIFDGASNIPYHDAQQCNRWNSLDSMLASLVTPRAA